MFSEGIDKQYLPVMGYVHFKHIFSLELVRKYIYACAEHIILQNFHKSCEVNNRMLNLMILKSSSVFTKQQLVVPM